jgi:hypothetical protein
MRIVLALCLSVCLFCSQKTWYSSDDFSTAYLGKKVTVVRRQIGEPERVIEKSDHDVWVYRHAITDTVRGIATGARLVVRNGVVDQVSF